ncbi:aminotransferase class V-fold PLP-dependent enzyme [Psychromarinibacter halotolerans]|uniref:Aminotransferase class V-fold PLP-dependent enzyme n=1 Tax=Psychromarinibacter halotolerans TaxID=1775175 RepID=A0ABV7H1D4_9RHOB|nr:aminotransferase class V-fold PLP-dependent enzyme [Psychromarinibacter halotolerans]MDF0596264.1 aminotransferase class V-fold PLP-dependent enzyme [Psychromarinibacter halotolerans]
MTQNHTTPTAQLADLPSLPRFLKSVADHPDPIPDLRAGVIGDGVLFDAGFGPQSLLYADYTASGRALRQVESFMAEQVLPFYANTHTEASFCGGVMTRLREAGRAEVARLTGAGPDCHVIFTGSGATGGLNRIVAGLDLAARAARGERVAVLTGPYEHHSNILPWRESGVEVIEIPEAATGGPDMAALQDALARVAGYDLVIGTFAAASNVTGILTDTDAVTRVLKAAGAVAVWDYAAAAPYIPIDMSSGDAAKDAIVFSPHKFPGGPGATGILVLRDGIGWRETPTAPGGGSVRFVSPWDHLYSTRIEAREEAGTPNVVGDIRAALALLVKDAVGCDRIAERDEAFRLRALEAWSKVPEIEILGQRAGARALPVFSFRVRDGKGGLVHHQLFTRMLSDMYGIQVRGGCACAGPYAHRLLDLDQPASQAVTAQLDAGCELDRPGWVRLNFSYLFSDEQADRVIAAVAELARTASSVAERYVGDPATARFAPAAAAVDG